MSTLSVETAPPQSRASTTTLLLPGLLLAAVWVGANFAFPGLAPTGVPVTFTRLAIQVVILLGLWLGLMRTDFSMGKRVGLWLGIAIVFTLWLAIVWPLAIAGAFLTLPGRPSALPIALAVPVIIGLVPLLRSKSIGLLLDAMPSSWLIGLQVYRVLGGIFLVGWAGGTLSGIFAWPAAIGDMITGVMALPAAALIASGTAQGRRAAIAWNIFGLLDFAVAITTANLTSPGPLQMFGFDITAPQLGTYPSVMTPAFAVPSSILLHALSLRQLLRMGQGAQAKA